MTDVLRKGLVMKWLFPLAQHRMQSQNLSQQPIVIGQVLQPIIVTVQPQAHHSQYQNVPQIQSRPPSGLLVADYFLFQQIKDLAVEIGGPKNPLQSRQNRRQFVPALQRQNDFLDGGFTQNQLNLESLAHGRKDKPGWALVQRIFTAQKPVFQSFLQKRLAET